MTRRLLLCILPLLMMTACSSDDPAAPAATRDGPGFDGFDLGSFLHGVEAGFNIDFDDLNGMGDEINLAAIAGDDLGFTDGNKDNALAAGIVITSTNQQLFTFDSIDTSDLTGSADTTPGSQIRVRGYRALTLVGTRYYNPTTTSSVTQNAGSLDGQELTSLLIDITSMGDDDFCVGFLELTPIVARRLGFFGAPVGDLENLFNGDYVLTHETGSEQAIIGNDESSFFVHDDTSDLLASVFTIERTDGGNIEFETLVALNREGDGPTGLHLDSRIRIEGYNGSMMVAFDEFKPFDLDLAEFEALSLADLGVERLRIEIKSICGAFKCDDMAISALLLRHVD